VVRLTVASSIERLASSSNRSEAVVRCDNVVNARDTNAWTRDCELVAANKIRRRPARWAEWASAVVEDWPDDVRQAPFDVAWAEESVRLAEGITALM